MDQAYARLARELGFIAHVPLVGAATANHVDLMGAKKDWRCSIADDRERRDVAGLDR
jgi:hypothetical protein